MKNSCFEKKKKEKNVATCLDLQSGLYHPEHFQLSLDHELTRLERFERPLGLVLVCLEKSGTDSDWAELGLFIKGFLRKLDVAARLSEKKMGILLPDASLERVARLLELLGQEFEEKETLSKLSPRFGVALVRPGEGNNASPEVLLSQALENQGQAAEVVKQMLDINSPWVEADTVLIEAEKDSLFAGFCFLRQNLNLEAIDG
jgi:hypothetical protein